MFKQIRVWSDDDSVPDRPVSKKEKAAEETVK